MKKKIKDKHIIKNMCALYEDNFFFQSDLTLFFYTGKKKLRDGIDELENLHENHFWQHH